ncbi:helix-turn-helix transcriptional regulator [uncultured Litoreibacter sp.]|uniref:helix-turn-helix domain-containing protein n=1 Tax=uncultured Litoreibacter sp. TaxID=1392394 RepID=UPI002624C727|nr:helix-turn-helix transcriptional regulator [uncultured Litoreibacter sp.]
MEFRDRIGTNVRKLRQRRNLSQETLSLSAGIDRGYVGRIERSEYSVSADTLEKLAFVLDVDPCEFTAPVPKQSKSVVGNADGESDPVANHISSQLLAAPFQEGFYNQRGDLSLVLIDYRWNDGSTVRRWLVDPKKIDISGIVFKPCAAD